jgi:hypothetical protein
MGANMEKIKLKQAALALPTWGAISDVTFSLKENENNLGATLLDLKLQYIDCIVMLDNFWNQYFDLSRKEQEAVRISVRSNYATPVVTGPAHWVDKLKNLSILDELVDFEEIKIEDILDRPVGGTNDKQ